MKVLRWEVMVSTLLINLYISTTHFQSYYEGFYDRLPIALVALVDYSLKLFYVLKQR